MRILLVICGNTITCDGLRCQALKGWIHYPSVDGKVLMQVPFWACLN